MQSVKLFGTAKKQLIQKPVYKKPVYKSYKQLLQLNRPRKKIEYQQSSSSDEDFLQKLLNQEKEQAKLKKARKKSGNSTKRPSSKESKRMQFHPKDDNKISIQNYQQIKLIRQSQTRRPTSHRELTLIKQENQNQKVQPSVTKFMESNKIQNMKGAIYIDNRSIQNLPILYSSINHEFQSTLHLKKTSAYNLLQSERAQYLQKLQPKNSLQIQLFENRIQHNLNRGFEDKFKFVPNIEPINKNWRYNLTIGPKKLVNERQFTDRKNLFRSKEQEQRFIKSLREISRKKK